VKRRWFCALVIAVQAIAAVNEAEADRLTSEALAAWKSPGVAVAIVQEGKVAYLKAHGVKDKETKAPLTPDSLFEIASTSKAFTAACLAMLVDDGKIAWDDPVRKHLEYFHLADPLADANVTVRDLVCHRTGMPRHDALWYRSGLSREEVVRRIGLIPPNRQFRQEYQYQNIMFMAAGELIGRVSGQGWDGFVRDRIFAPLGMRNTTTSFGEASRNPDRAMPHRRLKDGRVERIDWIDFENVGAAGCINSSVRDLAEWVKLQLAGGTAGGRRLISEKNLRETHEPHMVIRMEQRTRELMPETSQITYALGWQIRHYRGHKLVGHTGSLDGFRAAVTLLPEHDTGIVVLANLGPTLLPQVLTNSLVDHVLGLAGRDWNERLRAVEKRHEGEDAEKKAERLAKRARDTKPSKELNAYAGRYEAPGYGELRIAEQAGALRAEMFKTLRAKLEHYHYDTFQARDGDEVNQNPLDEEQFLFRLDADGGVAGVRVLNTEFRRVK
jgi:CubicO group peptidase (beta-lactamase class C family)